ncbi:hypothetical protein JXB31_01290 [Candidatus Woesearchaeota archaeon]|nr:hypothetical protein [Candidatus Woesearchaeota archaeon]
MHKKLSRKAVVEVQFNWLFIMIVGAIILIFFITIAGKYKASAEKNLASDVLKRLSTISTSGQMSSDTNSLIDIKDVDLSIGCDPELCTELGCFSEFDFADQGINSPAWMDIEPLFAPRKIKDDFIITWSLDWNMPFKVCSILYITYPGYRYIIVYEKDDTDSEFFADDLYFKLKENKHMFVEKATTDEIETIEREDELFTKYIFTFVPDPTESYPIDDSIQKTGNWDVIYLDSGTTDDPMETGKAYYSKIDNGQVVPDDTRKAPYLGTPLLIAAIYSDDYEYYTCNLKKIMLKYRDILAIYDYKIRKMHEYYTTYDTVCCYYYSTNTLDKLKNINTTLDDIENDITGFETGTGTISSNVAELDDINERALDKCNRMY